MAILTRILSTEKISGEVEVPRAGSILHRLLICSALSGSRSKLDKIDVSKDVQVTRDCLGTLGLGLSGVADGNFTYRLECQESDSTYKFLMPIAGAFGKNCIYSLRGNLRFVSMEQFYKVLRTHGLKHEEISPDLVKVTGQLTAGTYILPGVSDGQALSGLLMALPVLKEKSTVMVEKKPQSEPYVEMTIEIMRRSGIEIEELKDQNGLDRVYRIPGGQHYNLMPDARVEGDWTLAAYWLTGAAICGTKVTCTNLNMDSLQGDKRILNILQLFGVNVEVSSHSEPDAVLEGEDVYWSDITVNGGRLRGINIDAQDISELLVPAVVLACMADGVSIIKNAENLRISPDVVNHIVTVMSELGAEITEVQDGLLINGCAGAPLRGGRVKSHRDYRIAMMIGLASCAAGREIILENADAVERIYPGYFEELERLKGNK